MRTTSDRLVVQGYGENIQKLQVSPSNNSPFRRRPMRALVRFVLLVALAPASFGQDEYCLYFGHGGNVSVKEPAVPAPDAALTVECWFRSSARPRKPVHLVSRWAESAKDEDRGSFFLGLTGPNRVGFGLRNTAGKEVILRAKGAWLDGNWHHAAGTWNGSVIVLYLDGKELDREEVTEFGPLHTSLRPLVLGPPNSLKARKPIRFEGYLGGVALHDTSLSIEDLASSMNGAPRENIVSHDKRRQQRDASAAQHRFAQRLTAVDDQRA